MKILEQILNKIDFKKAFKIYFSISAIVLLLCSISVAYVLRDKIKMAIDYRKISESFERGAAIDSLKTQIDNLSKESNDIINIVAVDKNNNIIYKVNSNLINDNTTFTLVPSSENKKYLEDGVNKDVLYKAVKEDFIINRDFIKNHDKVLSDIDDDFYFEHDLGSTKINLLNFIVNRKSDAKIFIFRSAVPFPYVKALFDIIGFIVGVIGIIYWVGLALWVYKDSNSKKCNPELWGFFILFTNLIGLIIYTIYKNNGIVCKKCGALQNSENGYCTVCGSRINELCSNCHSVASKGEQFCRKCGNEL
jgi:hypothetical protein